MYNKIFTKILDSSIWLEPDATRIVWLTCIAAMDEDGFCAFAAPANLAHRANVTLDGCLCALVRLEGPDVNSSDPAHEGRRLERVPGGWLVLNAEKYREMVTRLVARESNRLRVKRHREKQLISNAPPITEILLSRTGNASEAVSVSEASTEAKSEDARVRRAGEAAATDRPLCPVPTAGKQHGRVYLHRWQIEALMDLLGDHAAAFELDAFLSSLTARAAGLVLTKATTWPWVQAELTAECATRGLPVVTVAPVMAPSKKTQLMQAGMKAFLETGTE